MFAAGTTSRSAPRKTVPPTEADERSARAVAKALFEATGYQIRSEDFGAERAERPVL